MTNERIFFAPPDDTGIIAFVLAVKCYNRLYGSIRGWTEYKRCFSWNINQNAEKGEKPRKIILLLSLLLI
jgi:hypothetical protein